MGPILGLPGRDSGGGGPPGFRSPDAPLPPMGITHVRRGSDRCTRGACRRNETTPRGYLGPPFPPAAGTFGGESTEGLDLRAPPWGAPRWGPRPAGVGVVSGVLLRGETGGGTWNDEQGWATRRPDARDAPPVPTPDVEGRPEPETGACDPRLRGRWRSTAGSEPSGSFCPGLRLESRSWLGTGRRQPPCSGRRC